MKKFIFLFLILAGCSSSTVKETKTTDAEVTSGPEVVSTVEEPTTVATTKVEEPERPVVAPPPSQYAALNEAIKAQNDERIYQAATQILSQSPNDGRALNSLAMYHYKKSRFDLSRYLLNKGIGANPKMSELHSNMGIVQLAQNERRDAIKSFRRALEVNGADAVAAANLGAIYTQDRDYNKAVIVLETAYKRGVRDVRVLNNYGIALAATGKFDRAESLYQTVLKEDSNNKEALYNYATLLIDYMGKYQDGLEQINRLKFVGGPSEVRNRIIALENKAKAGIK